MMLLAQAIGFLGVAANVISFQQKTRGKVLFILTIGCFFWTLHFSLMGFYTAAAMSLIASLRFYIFYKYKKRDSNLLLYGFIGLSILLTVVTWQGFISILPFLATAFGTYAAWQMSAQKIRWLTLPTPMFWFAHNIIAGSIAALISDVSVFISIVVGLWRYRQGSGKSKTVQDTA